MSLLRFACALTAASGGYAASNCSLNSDAEMPYVSADVPFPSLYRFVVFSSMTLRKISASSKVGRLPVIKKLPLLSVPNNGVWPLF